MNVMISRDALGIAAVSLTLALSFQAAAQSVAKELVGTWKGTSVQGSVYCVNILANGSGDMTTLIPSTTGAAIVSEVVVSGSKASFKFKGASVVGGFEGSLSGETMEGRLSSQRGGVDTTFVKVASCS